MRWIHVAVLLLVLAACGKGGKDRADEPLSISYASVSDLCDRLDLERARTWVPEINIMRKNASDLGTMGQLSCDYEGAERFEKGANRTVDISVNAYVFATRAAMDEWNSSLPDETDCTLISRAPVRNTVPGLGTTAVGYTCDFPDRDLHSIEYLMRVDDANLRVDIVMMVMVVEASVPAPDDVAAANRQIAESALAALRKP